MVAAIGPVRRKRMPRPSHWRRTSLLPTWGVALLKHGDQAGAEVKLKEAHTRGPHWADPLKVWADLLAKQGKAKDALAKYDEALKYAPDWKQLKEARDAVAKQKT